MAARAALPPTLRAAVVRTALPTARQATFEWLVRLPPRRWSSARVPTPHLSAEMLAPAHAIPHVTATETATTVSAPAAPAASVHRDSGHVGAGPEVQPVPRRLLDDALRIDYAGELAAVAIYEGQQWMLRGTATESLIKHMKEGEVVHVNRLASMLPQHRARPSLLNPLATVAGFALGAATAALGPRAAMACTVAVETVIGRHYNDQIRELLSTQRAGATDAEGADGYEAEAEAPATQLRELPPWQGGALPRVEPSVAGTEKKEVLQMLRQHRDDELEHLNTGIREGAEQAPFYSALSAVVQAGCTAAIWMVKRV